MPEETFNNNQRPTVIAAVILAALTAAGLWYFFVFRPAGVEDSVTETPLITNDFSPGETAVGQPSTSPDDGMVASPAPEVVSPSVAAVQTTATTGPAELTLAAALLALGVSVLGLRKVVRQQAR